MEKPKFNVGEVVTVDMKKDTTWIAGRYFIGKTYKIMSRHRSYNQWAYRVNKNDILWSECHLKGTLIEKIKLL